MNADLRLAVPAVTAWLAAGVAIAWPGSLGIVAAAGWAVTGVLVAGAALGRRHPLLVGAAIACCAASVVLTSAASGAPERQPVAVLEAADAGRFVIATAVTTQTALESDGSFTVTLNSIAIGDHVLPVKIPARVFGVPATRDLGIGTGISITGTLAATAPEDDLAFLLFTTAAPEVTDAPPWGLEWANHLRSRFGEAAAELPGDGGALLPGLAIGDTSAVSAELDDAMKSTSLSHLTAVSGANCAIVIGIIMFAGGVAGISRSWRIAASVTVLAGFVVLVTPEPSVLRAAVMALITLIAAGGGRPARGVPVLALSVLALLVVNPWLARSYGFILSVLATAGLLLLARPLTVSLSRWLPLPIAAVLAIPLAAQLACQPVLILLNASIPTYGIAANILAGPAAPVATVLGLIACLALPLAPPIGLVLAQVAWVPAAWIAAVATFFAALPGNQIPWFEGALGVTLLTVVTALVVIVAVRSSASPGRLRRVAAGALALLLVGFVAAAAGSSLRTALTRPANWQYAACDIGQGDAVLVRSGEAVALVDTGPDPALLGECLEKLGIERIDLLVLTHFDFDHVGGTSAVIGRVDRALIGPSDGPDDDRLAQELRDGGAAVESVSRGNFGMLGELRWNVLWPPSPLRGVEPGNDASVTLAFDGVGECRDGCLSSIFLGDLGEQSQMLLLATSRIKAVDVVKVAHHGSADQSRRLYERLDATVGIVSVGADNTYGHPAHRLLEILGGTGTAVARTDLGGLLLVAPDSNESVELWSERAPPAPGVGAAGVGAPG